jgi:predicted nucleotidyltransferase
MAEPRIHLDREKIAAFCRKWQIVELSLFGSVLRDDFRPDSDVDVLVTFAPGVQPDLPRFLDMKEELESLYGRRVDVFTRRTIERSQNPLRRRDILESARKVYEAA